MEISGAPRGQNPSVQCFKIDGIVWKFFSLVFLCSSVKCFKIDGIVWKYNIRALRAGEYEEL